MTKNKEKRIKAWAGIIGTGRKERIDKTLEYYGDRPKIYAIYPNKKSARYEEVRRVEIKLLKK